MYISLNWLKQFVDLPADINPKEFGLKLTMSTVEVEGFVNQAENLGGVVVGELLKIEKHPNADKLSVAQVDVGGDVPRQIVFGQMVEMKPGDKVPIALAPTVLPGNKKIEKAKLRGVESEGMLCLDQELGLLEDGVSIQFFGKEIKNGTPIVKALGLDDVIYEIDNKSVTNRPDLWGHYGMAREAAALYGLKLKKYKTPKVKNGRGVDLQVEVKEPKLCPRYMAVELKGIKVKPSPDWLSKRLMAIGQKSINNIVDVTNYVMFELGQPLHAFSAETVPSGKIIVRCAEKAEKLVTLDEMERVLTEDDLVIATEDKAIALAGIMGNLNSGIIDKTETVIIESANFEPSGIRKTASRLGLRSEASMRFEKSLDPNLAELAIKKAVELILSLDKGTKVGSRLVDVNNSKLNQGPIEISWDFIEKRIGEKIEQSEIMETLEGLGFSFKKSTAGLRVIAPTWRATKDISIKEDIIEEITRIHGYDKLKPEMPRLQIFYPEQNKQRDLEREVKKILSFGAGANEAYNYSFVSRKFLEKIGESTTDCYELKNPWSEDSCLMRKSLVTNLLQNCVDNLRFFLELNIFEIGKTFINEKGGAEAKVESGQYLPRQDLMAAGLVVSENQEKAIRQVKGVIDLLASKLNLKIKYENGDSSRAWCHPKQTLKILISKEQIGYVTTLHPQVSQTLDLPAGIGLWEINLSSLDKYYPTEKSYRALPKFPAIELDLSIVLDEEKQWQDVRNLVKAVAPELIKGIELLDIFKNGKIKAGKKSVTLRVTYQADDRTLEKEAVNELQEKIINQLSKGLGAEVRK